MKEVYGMTKIKFTKSEMKHLNKILREIFTHKRNITSPTSRIDGAKEFVLECERLACKLHPQYKDAVLIKGSGSYACKIAGIEARIINIADIAEIALTSSKDDAVKLRIARAQGCKEPYVQHSLGLNFMLDEVNAAVVATLLKRELKEKG